jgi:hypothetical protein
VLACQHEIGGGVARWKTGERLEPKTARVGHYISARLKTRSESEKSRGPAGSKRRGEVRRSERSRESGERGTNTGEVGC